MSGLINTERLDLRLGAALERAQHELLACANPAGYWAGRLSSSALSTATAVCALAIAKRELQQKSNVFLNSPQIAMLIDRGIGWLARNVNPDGGWGDTTLSMSNLSTTALCWAAFGAVKGADEAHRSVIDRAEQWLRQHASGLAPDKLAPAIIQRYGKDRTFSAPILTMCALAGRLGADKGAWRWVIQLPFELAACPHRWFAWLHLPVVSYALPALIAIGQARHHHKPTRSPIARLLRDFTRESALDVLQKMQPSSGGFLEATPLTSFVVMSLASVGQALHPVTAKGIEFLVRSARPDGSWPIDTNLATWLTTLSVNALSQVPTFALAPEKRHELRDWLLGQQYRTKHPYTNTAPGGWAWTNLPGGVPDADDTAGAMLALRQLDNASGAQLDSMIAATRWLLDLQNRDGGIPTFCRGWGALPFDRSSPDLTAHAMRALMAWKDDLPDDLNRRIQTAVSRAIEYLINSQANDGSWTPLWFGNQYAPDDQNHTYGTARVVAGLTQCGPIQSADIARPLTKAVQWLCNSQKSDGSWGGFAGGPPSVEETALAVEALADAIGSTWLQKQLPLDAAKTALASGVSWLIDRVECGKWKQPSPIGFYFARLWYYERLYPLIFTVAALGKAATVYNNVLEQTNSP